MQTAKLFQNGSSQAVRLPKEFRFKAQTEVRIERDGKRVILSAPRAGPAGPPPAGVQGTVAKQRFLESPIARPSIEQLIATLGHFEDFPDRDQPAAAEERDPL